MNRKRHIFFPFAMLFGFAAMLCLEIFKTKLIGFSTHGTLYYQIGIRFFGAWICFFLMLRFSLARLLSPFGKRLKSFWIVLPCFAIAFNNFPYLSLIMGDAKLCGTSADYVWYAVLCLSVGLFEELAFRGCFFPIVLERLNKERAPSWNLLIASIISSALFGLVHVANLFVGASPISVLLQVGYSFLIGAMCAVILVKTTSVWPCVFLHGIYNFAGGVVPEYGQGRIWTVPTVTVTVVVSIFVAIYVFYLLFHIKKEELFAVVSGSEPKSES